MTHRTPVTHTGPPTFQLRQHLAETELDPTEMYGLAVACVADSDAVDALCEHAAGSFCQLVALFAAAQWEFRHLDVPSSNYLPRLRDRIRPCLVEHVRNASEDDLVGGLRTSHIAFTEAITRPDNPYPAYVSTLFAEHAPPESLTDRVVAEMSVRFPHRLLPAMAFETPESSSRRNYTHPMADLCVSRFLLSKLGNHVPSWNMFKHLHTPEATIGDLVDLVAVVEQRR